MKLNLAVLMTSTLAGPVIESAKNPAKDMLVEQQIQPTKEVVPDLKEFLSNLYGEEPMTDNQILSLLIGSTPSPVEELIAATTAAAAVVVEKKEDPAEDDEDSNKTMQNDQGKELVHVLNQEIELIESLKKTEVKLNDELRKLHVLKEKQSILLNNEDDAVIEVKFQSSSTLVTSISTVCMGLATLLLL